MSSSHHTSCLVSVFFLAMRLVATRELYSIPGVHTESASVSGRFTLHLGCQFPVITCSQSGLLALDSAYISYIIVRNNQLSTDQQQPQNLRSIISFVSKSLECTL